MANVPNLKKKKEVIKPKIVETNGNLSTIQFKIIIKMSLEKKMSGTIAKKGNI